MDDLKIAVAREELEKRKNFVYRWKGILNRKFGWFSSWSEEIDQYYREKYPEIYE